MISTASSTARRRQRAEYELYKAEFEQLGSTERIPNAWFLLRILCAFRLAPGLFRLYPRMRVARQSEKQHNAHTFVNWLSTSYSPLQGAGFYGLSTFYSPSIWFAMRLRAIAPGMWQRITAPGKGQLPLNDDGYIAFAPGKWQR